MRKERAISMDRTTESCVQLNPGLLSTAERQLAAFARAVHELFGSEQARQSAEDWIEELELTYWPTGAAAPDWRRVAMAAAARLARRVTLRSQGDDRMSA